MNEDIQFAIDELDILMNKVARVHGNEHPELVKIKEMYGELRPALVSNDQVKALELLNQASALSQGFTLPEDACFAYTRLYKAFELLVKNVK